VPKLQGENTGPERGRGGQARTLPASVRSTNLAIWPGMRPVEKPNLEMSYNVGLGGGGRGIRTPGTLSSTAVFKMYLFPPLSFVFNHLRRYRRGSVGLRGPHSAVRVLRFVLRPFTATYPAKRPWARDSQSKSARLYPTIGCGIGERDYWVNRRQTGNYVFGRKIAPGSALLWPFC
jgi:hypothetical protein